MLTSKKKLKYAKKYLNPIKWNSISNAKSCFSFLMCEITIKNTIWLQNKIFTKIRVSARVYPKIKYTARDHQSLLVLLLPMEFTIRQK